MIVSHIVGYCWLYLHYFHDGSILIQSTWNPISDLHVLELNPIESHYP